MIGKSCHEGAISVSSAGHIVPHGRVKGAIARVFEGETFSENLCFLPAGAKVDASAGDAFLVKAGEKWKAVQFVQDGVMEGPLLYVATEAVEEKVLFEKGTHSKAEAWSFLLLGTVSLAYSGLCFWQGAVEIGATMFALMLFCFGAGKTTIPALRPGKARTAFLEKLAQSNPLVVPLPESAKSLMWPA